jgi:DNA primase
MITPELKQRISSYFKVQRRAFDYKRGWLKADCPFCNSEFKFGIKVSTNFVHCFKCGYVNSASQAIMELERLANFQAFINYIKSFNEDTVRYDAREVVQKVEVTQVLPDGFTLIHNGEGEIGKIFKGYLRKRGISLKVAKEFKLGFVGKANSKYFGYLIFPITNPDPPHKPIYFQTRRVFGNGPKFKNPTYEEMGIGKTSLIYNAKALKRFHTIYLVESIINGLTLGEQSIAILGKSIHPYQLMMILQSPVEEINIILDPDAYEEAIKLALKLIHHKVVRLVLLPSGFDVNDLGREATLKIVEETPLATYPSLLTKRF